MGVTVDGLAARLGTTIIAPVDVARARAALDDAAGLVSGYLRGPLDIQTDTVVLEPDCGQQLWLPFRRVQSVTGVAIGSTPLVTGSWSLRGDSLWRYDGWRTYGSGLNAPLQVTATVTHGFTDLPDDIAGVIYALAITSWQNPEGLRQFTVTQGSKSKGGSYATETIGSGTLGDAQTATLNRYRNRRVTSVQLAQVEC